MVGTQLPPDISTVPRCTPAVVTEKVSGLFVPLPSPESLNVTVTVWSGWLAVLQAEVMLAGSMLSANVKVITSLASTFFFVPAPLTAVIDSAFGPGLTAPVGP